jgi:pyruvate kinase
LIAKIEKKEAVENLKEIIEASDGIMVARGDLGVEIPLENVPLVQKDIIKRCNFAGKPVITATQMLMSMVSNSRPTRAEVTDVANAILDGTDAIMLSEETAVGNYPLEAVETMNKIALRVEKVIDYKKILSERSLSVKPTNPDAISHATCQVALDIKAKAIVTFTLSGSTARMVSRYRPPVPIIAASTWDSTVRKLALSWGVYPFKSDELENTDDMIEKSKKIALKTGLANSGDKIVITAGIPFKVPGTTNLLKVNLIGGNIVMKGKIKIGIIICDRYHTCAGGKCLRSLRNREGAFSIYGKDDELELVGYTTCDGCPGGVILHVLI